MLLAPQFWIHDTVFLYETEELDILQLSVYFRQRNLVYFFVLVQDFRQDFHF